MTITQDTICQLTCSIWESTLGLEVRPIPGPCPSQQGAGIVTARVPITGGWQGAVMLQCSKELAKKVARAMFGLDSEEPTTEEIRDALAEITHVTAGNLKSLVCGNCQLSMPEVSERVAGAGSAPGGEEISRQAFECQGERFVVALIMGEANPAGSLEPPGWADEPD